MSTQHTAAFKARAKFQFDAEEDDEISLRAGESVTVLTRDEGFGDGWWQGQNERGEIGLFPANFLEGYEDDGAGEDSADVDKQAQNVAVEQVFVVEQNDIDEAEVARSPVDIDKLTRLSETDFSTAIIVEAPLQKCTMQLKGDEAGKCSVNPRDWTVDDVSAWLRKKGFAKFVDKFAEHKIDGQALLSSKMDLTTLKELGSGTLDRRLRLLNQIGALRRAHRVVNSTATSYSPTMSPRDAITPTTAADSATPPPLTIQDEREVSPLARCNTGSLFQSDGSSDYNKPVKSRTLTLRNLMSINKERTKTNVDVAMQVRPDVTCLADVLLLPSQRSGRLDDLSIDYAGYLWKRGGHAHWSWKRRYFIIKDMTLWYFKSDNQDSPPLGLIPLPSYNIAPSRTCDITKRVYTFEVRHPNARAYYFKAESRHEMQHWMNAMTRSGLGIDFPRQCNEFGLPKLRPGTSFSTDFATAASQVTTKCEMSTQTDPTDEFDQISQRSKSDKHDSGVSEALDDQLRNKILSMGIDPTNPQRLRLPTKARANSASSLQMMNALEAIKWCNSVLREDKLTNIGQLNTGVVLLDVVSLILAADSSKAEFVEQCAHECNREPVFRADYMSNVQLIFTLLEHAERRVVVELLEMHKITPESICDGNELKTLKLVSIFKLLSTTTRVK